MEDVGIDRSIIDTPQNDPRYIVFGQQMITPGGAMGIHCVPKLFGHLEVVIRIWGFRIQTKLLEGQAD